MVQPYPESTIKRIIELHKSHKSLRQIVLETGVSINTVRKYIGHEVGLCSCGRTLNHSGLCRRTTLTGLPERGTWNKWTYVRLKAWLYEGRDLSWVAERLGVPVEVVAEKVRVIEARRNHETKTERPMPVVIENNPVVVEAPENVYVDLDLHRFVVNGKPQRPLSPSIWALFIRLAKDGGKIVTKTKLWEALYWNDEDGGAAEKIVDVFLCKLRPQCPFIIETVWGQGYVMFGYVLPKAPVPEPNSVSGLTKAQLMGAR